MVIRQIEFCLLSLLFTSKSLNIKIGPWSNLLLQDICGFTLSIILPALAEVNFLLEAGVLEGEIFPRGVFGVLDFGLAILAT